MHKRKRNEKQAESPVKRSKPWDETLDLTAELQPRLPPIKLASETVVQKQVGSWANTLALAIPKGRKAFVWFTYHPHTDDPTCFLLQDHRIWPVRACFDPSLSKGAGGTLLHGTVLDLAPPKTWFQVEEAVHLRGFAVPGKRQLQTLGELFLQQQLDAQAHLPQLLGFTLPPMTVSDPIGLMPMLQSLTYPMHGVQRWNLGAGKKEKQNIWEFWRQQEDIQWEVRQPEEEPARSSRPLLQQHQQPLQLQQHHHHQHQPHQPPQPCRQKILLVKPDVQNDIYHLFELENNNFVGTALVPDYVSSVKMNRLFRTIKENQNLDALEESDDEEEFENIQDDKFVAHADGLPMRCRLHPRFKKWIPEEVAQ